MKSLIALLILLTCSLTFAQPGGGGGQGGKGGPPPLPTDQEITQMVTKLTTELSLTSTQETQIKSLFTAHFAEVSSLTSGTSKPDRDEMDALKASFESDVKAVLTSEQAEKFSAAMKNKKGGGGQGRPQRD